MSKNNDGWKTILATSSIAGIASAAGYFIYELVRPKTLRDLLIKEGKQILSKDSTDTKAAKKWKSLAFNYKSNENASRRFSGLVLSKKTVPSSEDRVKKLQEKCDQSLDIFISKAESDLKDKIVDWCTDTSEFAKRKSKKGKSR